MNVSHVPGGIREERLDLTSPGTEEQPHTLGQKGILGSFYAIVFCPSEASETSRLALVQFVLTCEGRHGKMREAATCLAPKTDTQVLAKF